MNSKYISPFPTLNFPIYSDPQKQNNLIYEAWHADMCAWLDSYREDEFLSKPHINIYSGPDVLSAPELKQLHSESPIARIDKTDGQHSGTEHIEGDESIILADHPYILYAASSCDPKIPMGFTQFSLRIRYYDFKKAITVNCNLDRIYVSKDYRNLHVGAALVFATAEVVQKHCEDVLSQCKGMPDYCPPVDELEIYLYAELHSEGGENMVNLLNSELEIFMDEYEETHESHGIRFKGN